MRSQNTQIIANIELDRDSHISLRRQLADALASAISDGQLPAGMRLPSTRTLSLDLGVSRNTAVYAYEFLRAAGYLEITGAIGAVVSPNFLLHGTGAARTAPAAIDCSPQGEQATADLLRDRPFAMTATNPAGFPHAIWGSLCRTSEKLLSLTSRSLAEPGLQEARRALSVHLRLSRGLKCQPEQIVIVNNAMQAMLLLSLFCGNQGEVWVENPGAAMSAPVFELSGLKALPVSVDENGLSVANGRKLSLQPRLIYTTAVSQYPLGISMKPARRMELIEFAEIAGAFILERDHAGDLIYNAQPSATLCGQDKRGRVIFLSDFENFLSPALNFAYLVVPPALTSDLSRLATAFGACPPDWALHALASFIKQGHYNVLVRKVRRYCKSRRDTLIQQLVPSLPPGCVLSAAASGRHIVLRLPEGFSDVDASRILHEQAGLYATPLSSFYARPQGVSGLVLEFAGFGQASLITACNALSSSLRESFLTAPSSSDLSSDGLPLPGSPLADMISLA